MPYGFLKINVSICCFPTGSKLAFHRGYHRENCIYLYITIFLTSEMVTESKEIKIRRAG